MSKSGEKINIFISHRHEDENTAFAIRDALKSLDDSEFPRINFFLSEEIIGGEDWYSWVKERLVETNLLLLLFTDASRNWDWCIYEAGLFDRLNDLHRRQIVCLHSSHNSPPKPLQNLQAFKADPDRLRIFLKQLFIGTELLGNTTPLAGWLKMVPEKLDAVAQTISRLIERVPEETSYFNKYLFIEIRDPAVLTEDSIPLDAIVTGKGDTFAIFDKQAGTWTWKDIEGKARQNEDQRWLKELARAVYARSKKEIPKSIQAVFHSRNDRKIYIPILYRADTMASGSMVFKVLFHEDVSWQLDEIPEQRRVLITSLIMATRFRYELLAKNCDKVGGEMNAVTFENYCLEISQIMMQIESEAASRGLLDRHNLMESFTGEERTEVHYMFDKWYEIRDRLGKEIDARDQVGIYHSLLDLKVLNGRYLEIASRRYHQIITDDVKALDYYRRDGDTLRYSQPSEVAEKN